MCLWENGRLPTPTVTEDRKNARETKTEPYMERERETAGTKASSLPATIGLGDAYQIAGQTRVQSHPSLSCPLALLVSQRNREINFSRREPSFILFIDFFFLLFFKSWIIYVICYLSLSGHFFVFFYEKTWSYIQGIYLKISNYRVWGVRLSAIWYFFAYISFRICVL